MSSTGFNCTSAKTPSVVIGISHFSRLWRRKKPSVKVHRVTDPLFSKSKFNFSQTVGEMVFVSFEVEKMRMFLVQSVVHWYCVLMRSRGAVVSFPV